MTNEIKTVVASVLWKQSSQLLEAQATTLEQMGFDSRLMMYDDEVAPDVEIVFLQGPYGSMWPVVHQVLSAAIPPVFVYWFQQSLQWARPEPLRRSLAHLFSDLRQQDSRTGTRRAARVLRRGRRLGFLGDILWLSRRALPDVLGVSSTVYAAYLSSLGVESVVVPRGFHPSYGAALNLKRDISAVWMGKTRTRRRRQALYWLKAELERRGLTMTMVDGSKGEFVYGTERTQLLNKTRFVVNVNFSGPTDELSIRYYMAAANGAVVITEPSMNQYDFIPGKHLVEVPIQLMPETIAYYCSHESEWDTLSSNATSLVTRELTLESSIQTLMDGAVRALHSRSERLDSQHRTAQ